MAVRKRHKKSEYTKNRNLQMRRINIKHAYLVKRRDGFKCVLTGQDGPLDAHHVLGRHGALAFWDLRGTISIVKGKHFPFHHGAVAIRMQIAKEIIDYLGEELYNELLEIKGQIFKKTPDEIEKHQNEMAIDAGVFRWRDVISEKDYNAYFKNGDGEITE